MSKFEVVFSTDNTAFSESFPDEVGFVIGQVLRAVSDGEDFVRLRDSNGNRVGFFIHQEGGSE